MSNTNSKVSIIILHFNNIDVLTACLQSCQLISYPNYEIIIVNNGRISQLNYLVEKNSSDRVSSIINCSQNLGYAVGNNIGIRKALIHGAEYILLLNDDTIVAPDFLNILVATAENSPDTGMVGPQIYYFDAPHKIWFAGARFDSNTCMIRTYETNQMTDVGSDVIDSDYITGCALLVKKDTVETIGLLDERFFLYWEDVDWGLRVKKVGLKNIVVPSAHVWHKVSTSTGGMDSVLRVYHKTRSHLLMARIHVSKMLIPLHIKFFLNIAWLLFKSNDRNRFKKARAYIAAIRDYHLGKTDKGPQWIWNDHESS